MPQAIFNKLMQRLEGQYRIIIAQQHTLTISESGVWNTISIVWAAPTPLKNKNTTLGQSASRQRGQESHHGDTLSCTWERSCGEQTESHQSWADTPSAKGKRKIRRKRTTQIQKCKRLAKSAGDQVWSRLNRKRGIQKSPHETWEMSPQKASKEESMLWSESWDILKKLGARIASYDGMGTRLKGTWCMPQSTYQIKMFAKKWRRIVRSTAPANARTGVKKNGWECGTKVETSTITEDDSWQKPKRQKYRKRMSYQGSSYKTDRRE